MPGELYSVQYLMWRQYHLVVWRDGLWLGQSEWCYVSFSVMPGELYLEWRQYHLVVWRHGQSELFYASFSVMPGELYLMWRQYPGLFGEMTYDMANQNDVMHPFQWCLVNCTWCGGSTPGCLGRWPATLRLYSQRESSTLPYSPLLHLPLRGQRLFFNLGIFTTDKVH
jgi:hypothetical protein